MGRFNWRQDVMLPPSVNCSSYCKSCKGYTYWKPSKAFVNYHDRTKSFLRGEREFWTEQADVLKCTKCGRSVTV